MAVRATEQLIAAAEARRKRAETEKIVRHDELESVAAKLAGKKIVIEKEASEKGKLFAAVSAEEILMAIKKELGLVLDKERFKMGKHIKELGSHELMVQIGQKKVVLIVEIKNLEK
jgi:large subunit ribosomal protein L9